MVPKRKHFLTASHEVMLFKLLHIQSICQSKYQLFSAVLRAYTTGPSLFSVCPY